MNSAVYARHHNHVVARDAPPTLLWQSSRDKQQHKPAAAMGTPTPGHKNSARDTSGNSDSTANAALSNAAPFSNDKIKAENRLKALRLLYDHILPDWNCEAFSGREKAEIQSDSNLDKADPEFNFFTSFKLASKKGILPTPIQNYVAGISFTDTAGHMLIAESQAVRFDATDARTRTPVPVKVKMTVSGDSFTALLDLIIEKYKPDINESAFQSAGTGKFFPFDICFEYATPFQGSESKLVHFPNLLAHEMDFEDNPNFLENREKDCLDSTKNTVFLGFPCSGHRISGSRHVFGGPKHELIKTSYKTCPEMLPELLDPERSTHHFAALSEQAVPLFPRLYLSLGFDSRTGSESTLARGTVMDLYFEATFPMCRGCKAAEKQYTPDPEKCLGCFDMRLKQPGEFTKFMEDFHRYFKDSVTNCFLWGEYNPLDQSVAGMVRNITPLKPLVDKDHANLFTPALTQQAQRLESYVWRFELTHSFGRS